MNWTGAPSEREPPYLALPRYAQRRYARVATVVHVTVYENGGSTWIPRGSSERIGFAAVTWLDDFTHARRRVRRAEYNERVAGLRE